MRDMVLDAGQLLRLDRRLGKGLGEDWSGEREREREREKVSAVDDSFH